MVDAAIRVVDLSIMIKVVLMSGSICVLESDEWVAIFGEEEGFPSLSRCIARFVAIPINGILSYI